MTDVTALIEALRAAPRDPKEILELLAWLAEPGLPPVPGFACPEGFVPTEAEITRITAALLDKGYESTASEARRTGKPVEECAKAYGDDEYLIRQALTNLQERGLLPIMFRFLVRSQAGHAGYAPRHGTWGRAPVEKLVVLEYRDGGCANVLKVANHDSGFAAAMEAAEADWNGTGIGQGTDYDTFVIGHLKAAGYDVEQIEGFETYATCL